MYLKIVGERSNFKIFLHHARTIYVVHSNERGECVHVPSRSAHVKLGDVPRTLDPVEAEREFRQHDGVVTVMMKLPVQGFA